MGSAAAPCLVHLRGERAGPHADLERGGGAFVGFGQRRDYMLSVVLACCPGC